MKDLVLMIFELYAKVPVYKSNLYRLTIKLISIIDAQYIYTPLCLIIDI